jgi:hypothetical protein
LSVLIDLLKQWKLRFYHERGRIQLRRNVLKMSAVTSAFFGLVSAVAPRRTILTWPDVPGEGHVLAKLCALQGYACTNDAQVQFDFAWHFEDATQSSASLPAGLDPRQTVNGLCLNISKRRVAQVFDEVFGYSLAIDPTTYSGPATVKSDRNALHDGRTIQCPIPSAAVRSDCVYQRLIDNETGFGTVTDLRTVIHGGRIPLVYRKFRSLETRYTNTNDRVELCEPKEVFTEDERGTLLRFANGLGLDFGEVDVLRDRTSGKIYVVDANNTPMGPPNGLTSGDSARALRVLLESFRTFTDAR